jgi:ribosomal protein S18 acetylase RimI-like enzyme
VRRLEAFEWARLRELTLAALADSPQAFLVTLDDARHRSDRDWQDQAAKLATASDRALFVAEEFDAMASVSVRPTAGALLSAVWVAPERRGSGLADRLVRACLEWARAADAGRITLRVVRSNQRALAFYRRHGFVATGWTGHLRGQPNVELEMQLAAMP